MTQHLGTWKLLRGFARDEAGHPRPRPYGPKAMGLLTLNADGRMMAVLCDGRRSTPDGVERDFASYCGNYTFDGTTLITRVDASSTPRAAIGAEQVRKVRFENGLMVLTPPPTTVGGAVEYREMFWERLSPDPA